ncbi:hypothetical protein UJ101_00161 [Flavobacteriaceae bacterium UJ101]|nr:hypothetical protein UJ101_00161 [Flavobacteriaceae bacterium UJ101]
MIKNILSTILILLTLFVNGQIAKDLEDLVDQEIKIRYKVFVFDNLDLTSNEVIDFEPIFDQYLIKKQEYHSEWKQLATSYVNNYQSFTDDKLMIHNKKLREIAKKESKLEGKYYKEFSKVLPLKKVNNYFLIDRLLKNEIEYKALNHILAKIKKQTP